MVVYGQRKKQGEKKRSNVKKSFKGRPTAAKNRYGLSALSKRMNSINRRLNSTTNIRWLHWENALTLTSGTPCRIDALTTLSGYSQLWGVDHGTMANIDPDVAYIPRINFKCFIEADTQPLPTSITAILFKPTRMGNERTVTGGGMVANYDYFQNGAGMLAMLNPRYYKVIYKKKLIVGHFEYLSVAPGTNSNNPIGGSYRSFEFTIRTNMTVRRGLDTQWYTKVSTDLPYYNRYYLALIHDNGDAVLGPRVHMVANLPAVMSG